MTLSLKEVAAVTVLAIVVAVVGTCNLRATRTPEPTIDETPVLVHVAGAVHRPGVYQLPYGARVQDALLAAGGAQELGNLDALNLAAYIHDGQKIYVPGSQADVGEDKVASGLVNINTADLTALQILPGIGPSLAERIIAYREQTGGFAAPEDIMNVDRIGPKTFENIRDLIVVD